MRCVCKIKVYDERCGGRNGGRARSFGASWSGNGVGGEAASQAGRGETGVLSVELLSLLGGMQAGVSNAVRGWVAVAVAAGVSLAVGGASEGVAG